MPIRDDNRSLARAVEHLIDRVDKLEVALQLKAMEPAGPADPTTTVNVEALEERVVAIETQLNNEEDVPRGRAAKLSARIEELEARLGGT